MRVEQVYVREGHLRASALEYDRSVRPRRRLDRTNNNETLPKRVNPPLQLYFLCCAGDPERPSLP